MTPNDEKQLNLLSTLHYVAAAIAAPIPLFGAAYGVVTDAANCMHFPLGPPRGTIALLTRPGIRTAFEETKRHRAARDREPSAPSCSPTGGTFPSPIPPKALPKVESSPALARTRTPKPPHSRGNAFPVHRFSIYDERIARCVLAWPLAMH